ncbi:MadR family response regulator transcription factor [Pseudonocardia alni]|uniref:MadR family response regulator transcription factor n=1 Tax=Pseudonocardia alni TaxID=33907 RepID=UPI0033238610
MSSGTRTAPGGPGHVTGGTARGRTGTDARSGGGPDARGGAGVGARGPGHGGGHGIPGQAGSGQAGPGQGGGNAPGGGMHGSGGTAGTRTGPGPAGVVARPIRIVLVDDHSIMRQGLRAVLEREDDLRIVGEAGSAPEAFAAVATGRPQVVLLDLKLASGPQTDGLEVCRKLCADHPGIGVLVLTTFAEDRLVVESVQAGARGYVVKDVDTTELVRAIRAVSRGESAFDARSASAMVRSLSGGMPDRERLTDRELDVLRLLARGLSNRAIGAELFISETTVKFHVGNLMRKLMVSRRAEAVYAATKLGLL